MNGTAEIGHNNPPAFDMFSMALEDVRLEAGNFLDGSPIQTQAEADAISRIVAAAKKLRKDADAARADEKRPHDDAGKAVQAKWKPLLEQADMIASAAQRPLTDYLARLAAKQAEEARIAREEAARKVQEAIEAQRAAEGSIDAMEAAAALQKDADKAMKDAAKAEKAKAHVEGDGRAIGLRSYWTATVGEYSAVLRWVKEHHPDALREWLAEFAAAKVRAGAREIPGVSIKQERRVA